MNGGLLFIDKEAGMTSRAVDNAVQRLFHTKKVGHLGTLDPFATGLLIVAVNEATKYLPFLPDEEKTYQARLVLGKATSTGDLTGEAIEEKPVEMPSICQIEDVLRSFLGESTQIQPMTSAIKKDGVSLYKLAHKGIEVEREPRKILVHEIHLLEVNGNEILFEATVSKGTYVRTLGEDIAKRLGTLGHLGSLRRVKVGSIDVSNAIRLNHVEHAEFFLPSDYVPYPRIMLEEGQAKKARNGMRLSFSSESPRILLLDEKGPIAVYEQESGETYRCLRGL